MVMAEPRVTAASLVPSALVEDFPTVNPPNVAPKDQFGTEKANGKSLLGLNDQLARTREATGAHAGSIVFDNQATA